MKIVIKVSEASVANMNGEYDLDQSKCINGHLSSWATSMEKSGIGGRLSVGYYTFGESDSIHGSFHTLTHIVIN